MNPESERGRGPAAPVSARPLADLVRALDTDGLVPTVLPGAGSSRVSPGFEAIEVTGISDDSRAVSTGDVFIAVRGTRVDGNAFVGEAVGRGARAVIVERPVADLDAVQIVVRRGAAAVASAAAWWYGHPSRELTVVGVTGTNGKTTTTYLAAAALEAAGWPTGIIGTIGVRVGAVFRPNDLPMTTPGALDLQRILRSLVSDGERAAIIEASSHGLAAGRVGSVDFDAAILTNLSHEHLDFHGTFEAYRAAKLSLFERLQAVGKDGRAGLGIANLDDPHGPAFLAAARASGARAIGYGRAAESDVRLVGLAADAGTSRIEVEIDGRQRALDLRIGGRFNAHNALAALGLAVGWDLDLDAVSAGLGDVRGVPGRMEGVDLGQPFTVVVDYAHTPGSLEAIARELHELAATQGGGVISVFGASGERDVGKRPLMGRAAGAWSRLVIVTEDDSRNEDPGSIFEAIAAGAEASGLRRGETLLVIPDRRAAITEAFSRARPNDVVLLAGKGHETWNMGPSGAEPWHEREVAEEELRRLGHAAGAPEA